MQHANGPWIQMGWLMSRRKGLAPEQVDPNQPVLWTDGHWRQEQYERAPRSKDEKWQERKGKGEKNTAWKEGEVQNKGAKKEKTDLQTGYELSIPFFYGGNLHRNFTTNIFYARAQKWNEVVFQDLPEWLHHSPGGLKSTSSSYSLWKGGC